MVTISNTFKNISNFKNTEDYLPIFNGVLITELLMFFLFNNNIIISKSLRDWYSKFNLSAVIADVFIIVLVFIFVRYIYKYIFTSFSILKFIALLVVVQTIHDILFYFFVSSIKRGSNQMIDTFKDYIKEGKRYILIADSLMMITSGFLASYLANQNVHVNMSLLIFLIYLIPYFLYH
jgi:hypothetical protein